MPRSVSQNFCCQCPCPHREPQPPPASAGDPESVVGRSGFSLLWGHRSFPLCPDTHTTLCVPSKSAVSVFPSPVNVLLAFKSDSLILLPLLDPQVGKPDMELRTFTSVGGLLWYNCSPVCESPPSS